MSDTIINGTEFNCENIKYSSPKTNTLGGKSVNIFNKLTNSRLNISTPMMLTWGASDYVDKSSGQGNGKFEMTLQFPNEDYKNEEASAFLENLKKFEDKIKADAMNHSKDWFGKVHKSLDVLEALYSPMLKYSKDKNTGECDLTKAPSIRVKIPVWEGTWRCEDYDDEGTKLFPNSSGTTPVELIPKATNVKVLMTCGGIWFASGKFGVTWKLNQAIVKPPEAFEKGKCYVAFAPEKKADYDSDGETEQTPRAEHSAVEPKQESVPVQEPVVETAPPVPEPEPAPAVESKSEPAAASKPEKEKKKATKKAAE